VFVRLSLHSEDIQKAVTGAWVYSKSPEGWHSRGITKGETLEILTTTESIGGLEQPVIRDKKSNLPVESASGSIQ
jgi:hypothetical protein